MKKDFETELLSSTDIVKKSYSFLLGNIGKTVAIITGIIAILVSFTEISICDLYTKEFTSEAVLLLFASYIIFFSMEDAGEKLGRESAEYRETSEEYEKVKAKIDGSMIPDLRIFCSRYTKEELEFRKKNAVFAMGSTEEDFNQFLTCGKAKREYRRKFRKIKRMKPIEITPQLLLSREKIIRKSELSNPQKSKFLNLIIKMIPSTICTFFTASIILSAKDGMSATAITEALLKLSALPIFGFRGYTQGYSYVKESLSNWQTTKRNLLFAFLKDGTKSSCDSKALQNI